MSGARSPTRIAFHNLPRFSYSWALFRSLGTARRGTTRFSPIFEVVLRFAAWVSSPARKAPVSVNSSAGSTTTPPIRSLSKEHSSNFAGRSHIGFTCGGSSALATDPASEFVPSGRALGQRDFAFEFVTTFSATVDSRRLGHDFAFARNEHSQQQPMGSTNQAAT